MSKYVLVIFTEALSNDDLIQVSNLSYGADVERIDEDASDLITYAYFQEYDISEQGFCYRILKDTFDPAVALVSKDLVYVGKFDEKSEKHLVSLSEVCSSLKGIHYYLDGIGRLAEVHSEKIKSLLGMENIIDVERARELEADYVDAINIILSETIRIFFDCEIKVPT